MRTRDPKVTASSNPTRSNPVRQPEARRGVADEGRAELDHDAVPTTRDRLLHQFGKGNTPADAPDARRSLVRQFTAGRPAMVGAPPVTAGGPSSSLLQAKYEDGGGVARQAADGGPIGERAASTLGRA